jgi:cadmium resistance protein CadD (predicted permease)
MEGNFLELLGLGIATFVATNIDDLFILMAFFANRRFPISQVLFVLYRVVRTGPGKEQSLQI